MPRATTRADWPERFVPEGMHSSILEQHESPVHDFFESAMKQIERYARSEPWTFAMYVFGVGFILGWRLKPW